jgi:hypothetical protein
VSPRRRAVPTGSTRIALLISVGVVAGIGGTSLVSTAVAATSQTAYEATRIDAPDPQADGRWAERVVVAGDIDGDAVNDPFVGVPRFDVGADNNRGRVYRLSGRTGRVLYRINSPQAQDAAQFGFYISAFGDVDGDGKTDVAIGTDAQDVGSNTDQGKAWVFSGIDGSLLYALDNPAPQASARFGSRIGSAGDVTGDGIRDVIVGASNNDVPTGCGTDGMVEAGCYQNAGQAFIFNGATGALVRTLDVPPADLAALGASCTTGCGTFGLAVQSPGDTDGDGVSDQLVDAGSYATVGRMYLFSGRTGELLLRIDPPEPQAGDNFGFQDATPGAPGDIDRDGFPDLYANGFIHNGPTGEGQGRAWIFNGRTGGLIRQLDDPVPTPGGQFGWSLADVDYNRDGVPDQYIGQSPHHVAGFDQNGGSYVLDGRDGSLLKALEVPTADNQPNSDVNAGPRLGWTVASAGDLNADGEPDFLGGAPFADVGANRDQGRLYVFLSSVPAAVTPPPPPPGVPSAGTKKFPAKLSLARATIVRSGSILDVLAPITARASGTVRVELHAAGRRFRFSAAIDSAHGRVSFRKRIPKSQADLGTGIITMTYAGDADTRPQTVRLRAAAQPARLRLLRPQIIDGRLRASGTVTSTARGVVRLQLEYDYQGVTRVLPFRTRIANGRWTLNAQLSATALGQIADRSGSAHSYTLFTGYLARRMRGEMRSFEVLPDR